MPVDVTEPQSRLPARESFAPAGAFSSSSGI